MDEAAAEVAEADEDAVESKKGHFSMIFLNISAPAESRVAVFRWLTWHEFGERSRSREHKGHREEEGRDI